MPRSADAFGDQADDLVAQPLFEIDADIRMGGEKRAQRFRQEFGQRIGVGQHPDLAGEPAAHRRRDLRAAARPAAGWCAHAAAACGRLGSASRPGGRASAAPRRAPPPCCGCGWRRRRARDCARSAPCVMLPASTTWRNRLRSVRSKRMDACLRVWRRLALRKMLIALAIFECHNFVNGEAKYRLR